MNRNSAPLRLAMFLIALPLAVHAQDAAKPVHGYRITYTLTTSDAGKRISADHFAMTLNTGPSSLGAGRGVIKIGQKIPIATGVSGDAKTGTQTQVTYLDIGINIDATVTESPSGLLLASRVETSSVAPQPVVIADVAEPLIRQLVITNSSIVTAGKTVSVGSLDLPDTQRHVEVEVRVEPLP